MMAALSGDPVPLCDERDIEYNDVVYFKIDKKYKH